MQLCPYTLRAYVRKNGELGTSLARMQEIEPRTRGIQNSFVSGSFCLLNGDSHAPAGTELRVSVLVSSRDDQRVLTGRRADVPQVRVTHASRRDQHSCEK
jgi:hypothetical protein